MSAKMTHQRAKQLANEHLPPEGSSLVAAHATRQQGVWVVSYEDPSHPGEILHGGALVVTDEGTVHELSSVPGALEDLLMDLGRSPLLNLVREVESEGLMLSADEDPDEAAGLAAPAAERLPWPEVLSKEMAEPYFAALLRFVVQERDKGEVYPKHWDMFEAFHQTPYEEVRVVILGQDPYPNPGEAMGLAFSVPEGVSKPTSLLSIDKALVNDGFEPLPGGDLTGWASQGVFLLNCALTIPRGGKPSHLSRWKPFTDAVIRVISERQGPPVVFVLWGEEAQRMQRLIGPRHPVVTAPHPSSRGEYRRQFQESGTFSEVNQRLVESGGSAINWSIT